MGILSKLAKTAAKKIASMPPKKTTKTKKKPNFKKGNTRSIFKKQGPGQAKTQKATEGQRRYRVGQAKGAVVGAGSVLAVGSSVALYKKDAAFRSRLNAAQEAGQATVTYQGTTYKVPKKKIPLPIPKPKTTFSKFNKGKKIPYTERFKEIEQEKKAKK